MYTSELTNTTPGGPVFVSNIEEALVPNGHVTKSLAEKVIEISPRSVWYGYDTVVLPVEPDPAFLDYAASLGREPEVVVPTTIDTGRLAIRDGFEDPNVQRAVSGRNVSYYMSSRALYHLVTLHGGHYEGGDPGDSIAFVNNKEHYSSIARGVVETVPSNLAHGLHSIAHSVRQALGKGDVYVRHTEGGGGLGNRAFRADDTMPDMENIISALNGDQPDLWRNGKALVEPFVNFACSPAVTFQTGRGTLYNNRQITRGNDYVGLWSPVPNWEVASEELGRIGDQFAKRLGDIGFRGMANTDLGLSDRGELFGFEVNGRTPGSRHAIGIGEIFFGPWESWQQEGVVIKSLDVTYLKHPATFMELHDALIGAGLLATPDNPFGAVITIPPAGDIAGIQVHGRGYKETEELHQRLLEEVGHPTKNTEDHPIAESIQRVARRHL